MIKQICKRLDTQWCFQYWIRYGYAELERQNRIQPASCDTSCVWTFKVVLIIGADKIFCCLGDFHCKPTKKNGLCDWEVPPSSLRTEETESVTLTPSSPDPSTGHMDPTSQQYYSTTFPLVQNPVLQLNTRQSFIAWLHSRLVMSLIGLDSQYHRPPPHQTPFFRFHFAQHIESCWNLQLENVLCPNLAI